MNIDLKTNSLVIKFHP